MENRETWGDLPSLWSEAPGPGEPIGPAQCLDLDLVRGRTATGAASRRTTARLLSWWTTENRLDEDPARTLAAALVWAVRVETTGALAALLGALVALSRRDLLPPRSLVQIDALARGQG